MGCLRLTRQKSCAKFLAKVSIWSFSDAKSCSINELTWSDPSTLVRPLDPYRRYRPVPIDDLNSQLDDLCLFTRIVKCLQRSIHMLGLLSLRIGGAKLRLRGWPKRYTFECHKVSRAPWRAPEMLNHDRGKH